MGGVGGRPGRVGVGWSTMWKLGRRWREGNRHSSLVSLQSPGFKQIKTKPPNTHAHYNWPDPEVEGGQGKWRSSLSSWDMSIVNPQSEWTASPITHSWGLPLLHKTGPSSSVRGFSSLPQYFFYTFFHQGPLLFLSFFFLIPLFLSLLLIHTLFSKGNTMMSLSSLVPADTT